MGDIVIAPLFVARLGLIGYAYTSNDFITIYALLIDVFILILFIICVFKNSRKFERLKGDIMTSVQVMAFVGFIVLCSVSLAFALYAIRDKKTRKKVSI